jgi:hypothetical protein
VGVGGEPVEGDVDVDSGSGELSDELVVEFGGVGAYADVDSGVAEGVHDAEKVRVDGRFAAGQCHPSDSGVGQSRDDLLCDLGQRHVFAVFGRGDEAVRAAQVAPLGDLDQSLAVRVVDGGAEVAARRLLVDGDRTDGHR